MRRIVIIIVLVAVVGFAGYMLLRPKRPATRPRSATADTSGSSVSSRSASSRGRTAGRLKAKTKEDLKAEKAKRRKEERQRRRELKRQEREKRRRLKAAGRRRGRRSKRRRGGQFYVVSAIVSLGSESYALVDGRRVGIGDVVMGRRIVAILPDRLEVEAFGRMTTVRVGESLLPPSYYTERRRRG